MVIKNLENKIRLVGIICTAFLVGCVIISLSSIWTARTMVSDAQKKVYVLDGNVPILVNRTTMDETLDVEAKSHVEMFHHYFFTLPPDDKYIRYTMEKAMYLVDETGLPLASGVKPRYMSVRGIVEAYNHPIETWTYNDITVDDQKIGLNGSPTRVFKSFTKGVKAAGQIYEVDPAEAVDIIISKLKEKFII